MLVGAILFGYFYRSPWSILLVSVVFTAGYIAGKWPMWKSMNNEHGIIHSMVKLPPTYLTQLILVSVLYIIGYGLGALFGTASGTVPLSGQDFIAAGCLLVFSLGTVFFIHEKK